MTNATARVRFIGSLAIAVVAGCAPAYHSYSGCQVPCKYCAPPPLPYTHYKGCVCHSCAAAKYLSIQPQPENNESEGGPDYDGAGN